MKLTLAGEQVERALSMGYDVAAFNLYLDALRQDVEMATPEDDSDVPAVQEWHRSTQERVGWDEAPEQDGSILRVDTFPRNEDGVYVGGPPTVEYVENPDFEDEVVTDAVIDEIARALGEDESGDDDEADPERLGH